jgi:hypothetical protein
LNGRLDVGVNGGTAGTLTIEPGVTIAGNAGSDFIVVHPGSQIVANGTESNPIIMTSVNDLSGDQADPATAQGEWGGLVILGNAPINNCASGTIGTASCTNVVEGVTAPEATYGGATSNDNSGTLRYVQVRFAGNEISPGNELNGITFAGVGAGTTVEYIQVHNNSDDGVEFFGGEVNVKYLVLTGNDDDSIDTDNGYNGTIQYALVVQKASGDNIVEASSAGGTNIPRSDAKVANFTFISTDAVVDGNAFRLNTNTIGTYVNGVVDHTDECFRFQDSAGNGDTTYDGQGTDPFFSSVLFDCTDGLSASNGDAGLATGAAAGANNVTATSALENTYFLSSSSHAVTAVVPNTFDSDLDTTAYIGAFSSTETLSNNWTTGWTCGLVTEAPC